MSKLAKISKIALIVGCSFGIGIGSALAADTMSSQQDMSKAPAMSEQKMDQSKDVKSTPMTKESKHTAKKGKKDKKCPKTHHKSKKSKSKSSTKPMNESY